MADSNRTQPRPDESNESERDRVRSSNDRDQSVEREGLETEHNRGYDDAARGRESSGDEQSTDVDPDSAESDVDRDDSIDEP